MDVFLPVFCFVSFFFPVCYECGQKTPLFLSLSLMIFQMCLQMDCLVWCIFTQATFVWFFSAVFLWMCPQTTCKRGCKFTFITFVWPFSVVFPIYACFQSTCIEVALVQLFSTVCFQMSLQTACLPQRMKTHIGCICVICLHCAFLNVPLKNMTENIQSCIGCIYMAFLQCAFFKWVFKWEACTEVKSHCLHLFNFSPLCFWKCAFRLLAKGVA